MLLCGQVMASMDGSIVNVALPSMRTELPASGAQLQLIAAAYLLSFAALVVTGARLGDRYGHARVFRIGLAGFTLASVACGLAPSAPALVAARAVHGAAAAVMAPQVISLIQLRFAGAARDKAIGVYSMILAVGVAAGQIAGGLIVTADLAGWGWRPTLLLNVPIGVVSMLAAARLLPADGPPRVTHFDVAGVLLLATAVSAVVAPLAVGRERGWPAWSLIMLAAGVTGLLLFGRYERVLLSRGGQPLLDLRAVRPAGARAGLLACFLVMGAYGAFIFTLTLHLQIGLGFSPLRAGLTFVPFATGFAIVSLTWTRLPRLYRILPVVGPVAFGGGATGVVLLARHGWPAVPVAGLLFCAGAGHAAAFSPLFARLGELIGTRHGSALSALGNTGTVLASALSVAALGSLYLSFGNGSFGNGSFGNGVVGGGHDALVGGSRTGFLVTCLAIDGMLLVGAACASWTVTRPGQDG